MAGSNHDPRREGVRRFRVRSLGPRPGREGLAPGSGGKVLLTVAFADGEVSAYPFWPAELAPYEAAIRDAITTQQIYWITGAGQSAMSFSAPEMVESAPDRILKALQAGQIAAD